MEMQGGKEDKQNSNNDLSQLTEIENDPKSKTTIPDWIMASATVAIAVIAFFYTIFTHQQWKTMEQTLEQSEKVLNSTIENFRLEQRAWVGPKEVLPSIYVNKGKMVYVKEGQQVNCGVLIANSGKTPALKVNMILSLKFREPDVNFVPEHNIDATTHISTGVLQPGMAMSYSASFVDLPTLKGLINPASKRLINALTNEQLRLYMFGSLNYEDIFGFPHSTEFCLFLSPDLTTFTAYKTHNEAD